MCPQALWWHSSYSWSQRTQARISIYISTARAVLYLRICYLWRTMNYIKCDVSTICIGMAASMGAFLLSGGLGASVSLCPMLKS